MINQEQLANLLKDIESYNIEKTMSTDKMDKFCEAICAFSNDISASGKNGYLLIGVNDNGTLSGFKVDDNLFLKISNIRTDGNILPQPLMNVEKFSFEDGDVLVVEVQPSEFPPVRYKGRTWVRVGPRKSIASQAEEKKLSERRLLHIKSFDAHPCLGASIDDIDIDLFKKEYLSKAIAEDVLADDKRSIEEQLESLRFFDSRYNAPTNVAILLFGKNQSKYFSGAYVQYVRFEGKDKAGDIQKEFPFKGNLCTILNKLDNFIETTIVNRKPVLVSALREETFFSYPYWATRELLMNAIIHRDYESNAPIQFYEYDDRIEFLNHGGLYGKVSPENFPNINDYRNPILAESVKTLGFVNCFSRGIARVQKELKDNGNGEAVFDLSLMTAFKVVEYRSNKEEDKQFDIGQKEEIGTNGTNGDTNQLEKILNFIKENEGISQKALAEQFSNIALRTLKRYIKTLKDSNKIEFKGTKRSGGYFIKG